MTRSLDRLLAMAWVAAASRGDSSSPTAPTPPPALGRRSGTQKWRVRRGVARATTVSALQVGTVVASLALVACTGCGDSPTSPSPAPRPAPSLRPGDYTLTIFVSPMQPFAPPGVNPCDQVSLAAESASIPVVVGAVAAEWRIHPVGDADLGFRATLRELGPGAYEGPVGGQARDPVSRVIVEVMPFPTAPGLPPLDTKLLGFFRDVQRLEGPVLAQVQFTLGAASRKCPANNWRLEPR